MMEPNTPVTITITAPTAHATAHHNDPAPPGDRGMAAYAPWF